MRELGDSSLVLDLLLTDDQETIDRKNIKWNTEEIIDWNVDGRENSE